MKKITLLMIIVLFIGSASQAQITKGSILLGGNLSYSTQKTKFSSSSSPITTYSTLQISPAVGIALKQNLIVGIGVMYLHQDNGNPTILDYGGDIFLRKYLQLGKKFYFYAEPSAYVTHTKQDQSFFQGGTTTIEGLTAGIGIRPGISYAVNRKIHLEIGLNSLFDAYYSHQKTTSTGASNVQTDNTFTIQANGSSFTQPTIGFQFLFAK